MITREQLPSLIGAEVHDRDDQKIGTIGEGYVDHAGSLTWMSVRTGWFGRKEHLVPTQTAQLQGEQVRIPYERQVVKDAPMVDGAEEEPLSDAEVSALYRYYAMPEAGAPAQATDVIPEREEPSAMTRAEEQLHVGVESQRAGRARLRKHVVTEEVHTTVPVRHEEVHIEREPIEEGERAPAGTEIGEAQQEEVLYAERPVVEKETVPVERVRMDKETVTEERDIDEELRKEQIDVERNNQRRGEQR